jgi:hypothetical protein
VFAVRARAAYCKANHGSSPKVSDGLKSEFYCYIRVRVVQPYSVAIFCEY